MATQQRTGSGLLGDPQDQGDIFGASLGGQTTAPGTGGGIYSPLGNTQAQLAGGAAGVQRQNYGGALAGATKQFAFNPKYAAMDQALQRAIANAGFDRTNQLSQLDQGYNMQTSDASRQNDVAQKNLGYKMSSQGLGFSGINLEAQGDLNNDYQRYVGNLGSQFAGGKANVENQYGRQLGDIASQRETLFQQQGAEEQAARVEAARVAAEAAARQQAAQMQAQLQQQMIQQQQAAMAQQQAYMAQQQQGARSANVGVSGYQGGANGIGAANGQNWDQILGMINSSGDRNALAGFGAVPGLPPEIMQALQSRIGMLTESFNSEANRRAPVIGRPDASGKRPNAY